MGRKSTVKAHQIKEPVHNVYEVFILSVEKISNVYVTAQCYSTFDGELTFNIGKEEVATFKDWIYCIKMPKSTDVDFVEALET